MASRILNSQLVASVKRAGVRYQTTAVQNSFVAEREAVKHHAADAAATWKKISIFVTIPCLTASGINAYNLYTAHLEHLKHHPHEWVKYPYMNFRARNFFWGKESLFFNPKVNLSVDAE